MTTCIGCMLLFGLIAGGIYLYHKVERLDREITNQSGRVSLEVDDENG